MRGKHIRNKIRDTQATLNTLGFGDFGDRLLDKVMGKFARNKKISYADIDKYLSKYFIQWLCREAKLDGKDTEKILGTASVTDFRDLARNVFILDKATKSISFEAISYEFLVLQRLGVSPVLFILDLRALQTFK